MSDALPLVRPEQEFLTDLLGFRAFMTENENEEEEITFVAKFDAMPATEVFLNKNGGVSICISQDDESGYPQIITFPVEVAHAIAHAIVNAAAARPDEPTT